MSRRVVGWALVGVSLLFFTVHLSVFQGAAATGNMTPGWPVGYLAIASVVVPFVVGVWLVLRRG